MTFSYVKLSFFAMILMQREVKWRMDENGFLLSTKKLHKDLLQALGTKACLYNCLGQEKVLKVDEHYHKSNIYKQGASGKASLKI